MKNPFEFGRELEETELVDRQDELAKVAETLENAGRLFLIGPRRFGKTSVLKVAAERAERNGVVVIRRDAEAYPSIRQLAESIVADAAKRLASSAEKAGTKVRQFFGSLRPSLGFDPMTGSFSASLTTEQSTPESRMLTDVLDGLDVMAGDSDRRVAVIIDEFQQIVESGGVNGGIDIERQIRASVQRHKHVAYVFAGSKTTLLTEMTGDTSRPFYRLGERLFVGPIPRTEFAPFVRAGFESAGFTIDDSAVTAILDYSEDVPYNVQRLAHACWNHVRDSGGGLLDPDDVRVVLERLVRRDDPFYTQTWRRLPRTHQTALIAIASDVAELFSMDTLTRLELAPATMQSALKGLLRTGIIREDENAGSVKYRLEDPFFGEWVRLVVG